MGTHQRPIAGTIVPTLESLPPYNRLLVEAVLYRYRTGIPRRDLPEPLGDLLLGAYSHSADGQRVGCARVCLSRNCPGCRQRIRPELTPPSDQVIGRSKGGLSTKIHAIAHSRDRNPLGFHLTCRPACDARRRRPNKIPTWWRIRCWLTRAPMLPIA